MIRKMLFVLTAMTTLYTSLIMAQGNIVNTVFEIKKQVPAIKVLLKDEVKDAMVEVRGGYNVYDPGSLQRLSTCFLNKRELVKPMSGGIKWGEQYPDVYQLELVPDNNDTTILVNGVQYRGSVILYQIGDNKLGVVNVVPIEDYIKSTLSSNFDHTFSQEAMAAVAIAARTEACFDAIRGQDSFWDVKAEDVGYQGMAVTVGDTDIDRAVDKTKFFVMQRADEPSTMQDRFFAARWTDNSAGKTAPFYMMFRRDLNAPKTGVEVMIAEADRANTAWSYSISKSDLAALFEVKSLKDMELFADPFSHKVFSVRFVGSEGYKDVSYFQLADILGTENVKSSDFTVQDNDNTITFSGFGKGHGVGICLYSADIMAQNSKDADQILSFFFPGTRIVEVSR